MKKIEAIVRQEKLEEVKQALLDIDVMGITIYQVVGCGHQKGSTHMIRGSKVDMQLHPKVKFEIVVSTDEWAEKTIEAIRSASCTGNVGDGKIFVYDLADCMRIRTGERGIKAI